MKKILSIQWLLILFFMANCGKKEVTITPITPITPSPSVVALLITDFSLNGDIKATISNLELNNGTSQNQIIMVLPETFPGDEIAPIIKLSDEVESISPKSGEKVSFEGKPPVEYTLTKKDGKKEKYLLYVQRRGELKVELLTKEILIVPSGVNKIQLRLLNIGTLLLPEAGGSRIYARLKANYYDNNNNTAISFSDERYEDNKVTFEFYKAKTGKISLKVSAFSPIIRESVTLDALINKGDKIFVSGIEKILNDYQNKIEGINFDEKKTYKIRLENDFIKAPIELPLQFIDENELDFKLPNFLENTGYNCSIFEDNVSVYSQEAFIAPNYSSELTVFPSFFMQVSDYQYFQEKAFITSTNNFKFSRSEPFYTYRRSYGLSNADLKMINITTKKEYNLLGEQIGCCDGSFSFLKFTFPNTLTLGDYEVYGVIKGVSSTRYSKKIEVTK